MLRQATPDEKAEYALLRGRDAKALFREAWDQMRVTNVTGKAESVSNEAHIDTTIGVFRNFWSIAE